MYSCVCLCVCVMRACGSNGFAVFLCFAWLWCVVLLWWKACLKGVFLHSAFALRCCLCGWVMWFCFSLHVFGCRVCFFVLSVEAVFGMFYGLCV